MNKKNTVNVSFSNVLLTWHKSKWWKKFKSNAKPNCKYCIYLSIQNPNTQSGERRSYIKCEAMYGMGAEIRFGHKKQQSMSFLFAVTLWAFRLFSLVFSKSLSIEVFHTGLVYYQWCSRTSRYWSACNFTTIWTPSHACFNNFNEIYQTAY